MTSTTIDLAEPPVPPRAALSRVRRYIPGKPIREVQRELNLTDVVKLASNENPLGPSSKATAAICAAVSNLHVYPESTAPELKSALASKLNLPVDHIFIGNGSDEVLRLICVAYLNPGDRVVVPGTSFPTYANAANAMDANVVTVPLKDFAMDLDAMASAVKGLPDNNEPTAKLVFLCRPNNPTGTIFPEESFRDFLDRIGRNVLVVVDEAYIEFDSTNFNVLAIQHEYPQVIATRTFSKIYGLGGLRIGYGIAHPTVWSPLYSVREPFTINTLAQVGALAALEDEDHVRRTIDLTTRGKQRLYRLFDELGLYYVPSEANFVLVDIQRPATPVYEALLRDGVIIRPGFGLDHHIRISIGTDQEMDRLEERLRVVLASQ